MNGDLLYAFGDDFDVRREVWALKARVDAEERHRGFMSAVRLLFDLALDGFKPDDMRGLLEPTEVENILVFEDAGVRLIFNVPGNGRLSTPDIMLLVAEFYPAPEEPGAKAWRLALILEARRRGTEGQRGTWPLVKR